MNMLRPTIAEEMNDAGRLSGYQSIWHTLRLKHEMHVPCQLVARLMKGVEERRSRQFTWRQDTSPGLNFCCQVDSWFMY